MKVRDGAKMHDVVFVGSTTAPGYKLVDNDKYSNIAQEYELTIRILKNLPVDVFVATHGSAFVLLEKMKLLGQGTQHPFIDTAGYKRLIAQTERKMQKQL